MIRIKRVYEAASPQDGKRLLVDRLWPRGVKKEKAQLSGWIREAAPSNALRKWYGHDPAKWLEFKKRYVLELSGRPDVLDPIVEACRKGRVTLLFGAKDEKRNNAVVLKDYLESQLREM